ncbi:hypothetical protein ACFQZT_10855 [Paenibacillus sp. GCM10027628]|uniref:hypothetical protein n=1 Tax=Paenibacillus sp. GCM10027628 TaxID=3273413 RepID=UPI0036273077
MQIIHTLPLLIREGIWRSIDLDMLQAGLNSLNASKDRLVVIYNQGCLTHDELNTMLDSLSVSAILLGQGDNVGITQARQACFEYIWNHFPNVRYISEIHVDMLFPPNWYAPLLDYLAQSDEPMISPGIVTGYGELQPIGERMNVSSSSEEILAQLKCLSREQIHEGFVHPVVHKTSVLQEIGGYDTRFLRGKQGYEDDSLLLGYLYYMGTRTNWRPKCCLQSWVYHLTLAQRMSLSDKQMDFELNEEGLFQQYGVYGLQRLSEIHRNTVVFDSLIEKWGWKRKM